MSAEERLRVMSDLAREGWELAGRKLPEYERANIPLRLYRPPERPAED